VSLLRLIRKYLFQYRKLLLLIVVFQTVQTVLTLLLPTISADIINNGILHVSNGVIDPDLDYIYRTGALMLGVTLVQVVFAVIAMYFGAKAAMAFGRDVRQAVFRRVSSFATSDVNTFGPASLITRITNDVQQAQMLVAMMCTFFVGAPIMIVGGLFFAIREDGSLSLILLVAIPALVLSMGLVVVRLIPQFEAMQERIDRVNQVLREQITGMRVVRAFVREPEEGERFRVANANLTDTSLRAGRLQALLFPSVMLVLNVSSVAAVWIGANRVDAGDTQIGTMIAFLTYLIQILTAVMMATFVAVMWPRAAVCAGRLEEVLDVEPSVRAPESPVAVLPERATFEMRNVSFRYPGAEEPVLSDISFRVGAGEKLAIVGSTGAGKTTLINLGPRLYDATGGTVLVDGVDVRAVDPELLWSHIGLIPQRPYLFTGTVATNLRFGREDATEEELWEALEVAQARDFVAAMPRGLESRIAQGGTNVSGGQRQRLAIARALVKKPDIFLFDDSFSALDLTTDARLRAALEPIVAEAAVVIVAQRISTILDADQILVIEGGRAVGLGPHAELLETCPTYVEIVESQVAQEEAA
jgi:ATP-binding cassette subfamily B protein